MTVNLDKVVFQIRDERLKQMQMWGNDHDDTYTNEELARASAAYALCCRQFWPTFNCSFHPLGFKDDLPYRARLVRAAALLVAEIERIDRKEATKND